METVVYYVALLTIISVPPGVLCWYLIHPFARRWRRVGPAKTYFVVFTFMILLGFGIWLVREPLLRVRFGFSPILAVFGVLLYAISLYFEFRRMRHLTFRMLVGLPEVSAGEGPGKLLTEGIYGRVRHPRYLSYFFGIVAVALVVNYLAIWLLALASFPAGYLLVLMEERELRQRFGERYAEYCRKVPRFVPRFGRNP